MSDSSVWSIVGGSVLISTVIGWMAVRMIVRLVHERARAARCYRRGVSSIRAYTDLMALMEGGYRREFWWTLVLSYGLSLGATAIGAYVSYSVQRDPSKVDTSSGVAIAAALILTTSCVWLRPFLTEAANKTLDCVCGFLWVDVFPHSNHFPPEAGETCVRLPIALSVPG